MSFSHRQAARDDVPAEAPPAGSIPAQGAPNPKKKKPPLRGGLDR
jgi:hypothetical protein